MKFRKEPDDDDDDDDNDDDDDDDGKNDDDDDDIADDGDDEISLRSVSSLLWNSSEMEYREWFDDDDGDGENLYLMNITA